MPKDKPKDIMILDEKVMVFIVMASEMFKKQSSAIFKQHGLTFSHYNVLNIWPRVKMGGIQSATSADTCWLPGQM